MSRLRYSAFGPWLKKRFGQRVYKVSVDGGFTCPNRDGSVGRGGCTYCNNDSFRAAGTAPDKPVEDQIREGIDYVRSRFGAEAYLVYWQNFSGTYAPVSVLRELYSRSLRLDSSIVGMTVGTRPDCVDREKLDMIRQVAGDRYVCLEYGLESIFDETLRRINRGHDFECYRQAVSLTRERGMDVCAHLILGFPWESRSDWLSYAEVLNAMDVQFVKLHHLHVVEGTRLAREYRESPFPLFDLQEWVEFACDFLERLSPDIVVQRLFGWTPEPQLVAPRWNRGRAEIQKAIVEGLERRRSRQGARLNASDPEAST